jgi:hypothetical protein
MTDTDTDTVAEHHEPIGKAQYLATWRKRMRMAVPTARGTIADVLIVRLFETTAVNRLPLDALIEGQTAINAPVKRFGVLFGPIPPDWPAYGLPVLWICDSDVAGRWN